MFISKEYLSIIDELNSYVTNPKINFILLENPPYRDSSGENSKIKGYSIRKSFISEEFKKEITHNASVRDLSNLFI